MVDRKELLKFIDPASCDYSEWVAVGQAIKEDGGTADEWDDWSASDGQRYHPGECERKWQSFHGSANPVTVGTLFHMAQERGYIPEIQKSDELLDWDSVITIEAADIKPVVDRSFLSGIEVREPADRGWKQTDEIIEFLETLFETDDHVGFVNRAYQKTDETTQKWIPADSGVFFRTAGWLIEELQKRRAVCSSEDEAVREVFGDYSRAAGMWIRFNPLDGQGAGNANVTKYRYTLVESDKMSIELQYEILKALELPIATLVYSGGKSLHAIVKVDASTEKQYQERVRFIYEICEKNGLELDRNNKNSSRLSRIPGVWRQNKKQFLIATNIGKASFQEWKEYQEELNDELPEFANLEEIEAEGLPELAPEMIDGVLRKGHKMLVSGPAKAGKSFSLIELAEAISCGGKWLGRWRCREGKVLYINLEVDTASCFRRFEEVGEKTEHRSSNIEIWNLRGESLPLDKLVPKLVRRCKDRQFSAVIIDPIYKVITGDENSAEQMALFCNQFDRICRQLECSVIYCHHHSKSAAANANAANRASGSGVFQRDPDAVIDLVELRKEDSENIGELPEQASVWRVECSLREFASPKPFEIAFDYPIHYEVEGFEDAANRFGSVDKATAGARANQSRHEQSIKNSQRLVEWVSSTLSFDEKEFVSVKEASKYFEVDRTTIYSWVDKQPELRRDAGRIYIV